MASTYVNNLRVAEPADGDSGWGTSTNASLELIGEALGIGSEGITTNADTHTSTVADGSTDAARAFHLKYTGTLDSTCTITIAPNTMKRVQIIENATSGSQSIIISQGSGANVTIGTGSKKMVYLDGAGSGAAVVECFFGDSSVVTAKIAADAVTQAKIADDAVGADQLASSAVVTASIVDDAITSAKIADDAITSALIADDAVVTAAIADDAITSALIADDAVGADQLASSAVVTASIVDDNVTQAKIADDAVGADQLAASAVVTASIVDDSVTQAKIADDAVGADQLASDAVVTASIADDAVTLAKMASGTDGNIISYDASGNPVAVATGSAGQVLTSAGAGSPPTFASASGGGLSLQATPKTANFTAVAGEQYIVDTSSSAFTMTFPASPSVGDTVGVIDYAGTFHINNLALGRNSVNVLRAAADGSIDTQNWSTNWMYVHATPGWLPVGSG